MSLFLQLTIMGNLMKKSLELLEKAETDYEQAVNDIVAVNSILRDFNSAVRKMLRTDSEEHTAWTNKLRTGAYSTAGSITVGMIIADIFGCLGICSTVGNAIGWGSAVAATEASIAA